MRATEDQKARYDRLKASKLCVKCVVRPTVEGRVQCNVCLTKVRRRVVKAAADGLCNQCRKNTVDDDRVTCGPCRAYRAEWIRRYPDSRERFVAKLREQVFAAYGGAVCTCCGETCGSMLCIDHVANDGAYHRRELKKELGYRCTGYAFYVWLKKNNFPSGFQVLCFNCNQSRSVNHGICEHNAGKRGQNGSRSGSRGG